MCHIFQPINLIYLKKYRYIKYNMPTYQCEKCDKMFDKKSVYDRHMKRKTPCKKEVEHKCEECGDVFATRFKLKQHTSVHNLKKNKVYHCDYCDRKFTMRKMMFRHMEKSCPERPEIVGEREGVKRRYTKKDFIDFLKKGILFYSADMTEEDLGEEMPEEKVVALATREADRALEEAGCKL